MLVFEAVLFSHREFFSDHCGMSGVFRKYCQLVHIVTAELFCSLTLYNMKTSIAAISPGTIAWWCIKTKGLGNLKIAIQH